MHLRVLIPLLMVGPAVAQVVRLAPIADTTADALAGNRGADPEIGLGTQFTSFPWLIHLRGFFQFDLTSVQGLGVPVRASLYWYQSRVQQSAPREVTAHRVTGSWSENALTWSNMPPNDPQALASTWVGPGTPLGWQTWDITGLARDWSTGAAVNQGVVLRHPTETNFDLGTGIGPSRENASIALRPYLELDFGTTFGLGCATGGAVPLLGFAGGSPARGSSFTLRTTGFVVPSLPGLLLGTDNAQWSGAPLPLSLAAFGFPTCRILVAPESRTLFASWSGTAFDVTLAVPNNPVLPGMPVFAQTAAFGPAGSLQLSNGFGLTIL
jgi:hypothetical protein